MVEVKVTIEIESKPRVTYTMEVSGEDTEDNRSKVTNVVAAAIELGVSILDAKFVKTNHIV